MRKALVPIVVAFLLAATGFAIWSLASKPSPEAASAIFALLATVLAVFVDRWLTKKERRQELLYALGHELYVNRNVIADPVWRPSAGAAPVPKVYPRVFTATLDTVIGSGAFNDPGDRKLFNLLHRWREEATEFNRRLDITELRTFMNPHSEELTAWQMRLAEGAVIAQTRGTLTELTELLLDSYSKESRIDRGTVLFGDDHALVRPNDALQPTKWTDPVSK